MNNLIELILDITNNDPEWKYINRKGHIITCTKAQFKSYFKKRKVDHDKIMKGAIDVLLAPCPMYAYLIRKEVKLMKKYRILWEHLQLGNTIVEANSELEAKEIAVKTEVLTFETVKDYKWKLVSASSIE